ncbi:hypothetical protein [Actinoplanes sp. NPDC049316]|uniref:hypothetical protein n=1 Tax=Actinoplanes sp. NPDC049316 TaxID=3154727 RepID=UPI00341DFC2B
MPSFEAVPVGPEVAKAAGALCGKAGTRDVVDATAVTIALGYGAVLFTSDPDYISALAAAADISRAWSCGAPDVGDAARTEIGPSVQPRPSFGPPEHG